MIELVQANWLAFALALVIGLLVAWWLFGRAGTPRERSYRPDVLDEGQAPAQRNQALIDAPPAAQIVPPPLVSDALGGMGEAVAMAATAELAEAQHPAEVPQPADPAPAPEAPVQPDPAPELPDESPQETPPAPQIAPEPMPTQDATSAADDLAKIKGLGPKLQALLPTLGLSTYAQIAALDDAALADLDGKLGAFAGRPKKDNWVAQAQFLAAGDVAGFEAQFGKI